MPPKNRSPRCRCVRRPFIQRRFVYTSIQRHLPSLVLFWLLCAQARADAVVVFNEVMYHPATNEAALEWLELHNQNAVNVEISGWQLSGAINYEFAEGTVISGGGYLVVALSPSTLKAATGATNIVGPFTGRLSNSGETLRLRDRNLRLMDTVNYGVDGEWPVAADGSGVSLAKRNPNLGSALPANWAISSQIDGTPGVANFSIAPVLGPKTVPVPIEALWRFDDRGIDLGTDWKGRTYDDSGWSSGTALFHAGGGVLPASKNTALAPHRNTYYFRGTFSLTGNPSDQVVTLRPIVDDGAIIYVNGTEAVRYNMPSGPVTYSTMASSAISQAAFSGPFNVPSSLLVPGQNVLAVEVHQTSVTTNAGLRLIAASGTTVAWDGSEGDFSTPVRPALAPTNAALASRGVEVFTTSNPAQATNLIDGRYGDSSSWSPAAGDTTAGVILRFNQTIPITSIAWGRDNGDTNDVGCSGGTCTDRTLGNYTFQYTLATDPSLVLINSSNPSNGWATLGTAQYLSAQPGFAPHLRHRFAFSRADGPILATGVRLRPPPGSTLDEIEINPPALDTFDAAFGLEVTVQEILPPPPRLVFNEVSPASTSNFWVEIINLGDTPAALGGMQLVRSRGTTASYTFPAQTVNPGEMIVLSQAQLGFNTAAQDKLFLYTAGRARVLDAVTVQGVGRARFPNGSGPFYNVTTATPGAANLVMLRSDVVFNEVMYHARPFDPVAPITQDVVAVRLTNSWRYDDSGSDLGTGWRAPGYNDAAWPVGSALFSVNAGSLPARTNTTLAPGRTTYYFRTTFNFTGSMTNLSLNLRTVIDDGAVVYLNGLEIHRQNLPAGVIDFSTSATGPVGDATITGPITLPAGALVQGLNVLAVEVHQVTQSATSSGITLTGGGLTLVEEGPLNGTPPMNLARQPGVTPFVIDSLAGYPIHDYLHLNDGLYGNSYSWIGNSGNPGYAGLRFNGLFTISSFAFARDNTGTFTDRTLGLYTLQYTRVANPGTGTAVTGNPETGWATIGTLNYQGAGSGLFANPSRRHRFTFNPVEATGLRLLVPGTGIGNGTCIDELEVNPPETSGDVAFGAELLLTTTLSPAVAFAKSPEEWVELFNRGSDAVDLTGWRLDDGIHFSFPSGTVVPAGGYLVVASDAAELRSRWPEAASTIFGNFSGKIGEGERLSLKDAAGNRVNSINAHGRGWSDGGGSSLELIDARAANQEASAWADSDETARGVWQTVTYRMIAGQRFGNVFWNEFRLGMLDAGELLIDDVSVVREPEGAREQIIQNGDFETITGNTHWRMLGNHGGSQIITDPFNPANHVLKISATGPARTSHNHIESTYLNNKPLVDGQEYEVRFRARWMAGSPQLGTTAYFQKLARTTNLQMPARSGTPGAPNSRRAANAGPQLTGLKHGPVVPQANEPVTISVRANDPDGLAALTVFYRVNPATAFVSTSMTLQSDGSWSAILPGQTAGRIVQFYVRAEDGLGATATAPEGGPNSRALYQVADAQGTNLRAHELRLIQLDADRDFMLNSTNVMSQGRLGGTVIYDRVEAYYDVAVRLHGSAAGRARDGEDYISYDISFPEEHPFRGAQSSVGIDRSGRAPVIRQQHEIFIQHMFQKAGLPAFRSDLCYFIAPRTGHTGTAILQLGAYNGLFVEEQFGQDGSIFNFDLTYEPSTTVGGNIEAPKLPVPLQAHVGTDFTDLGPDKEQYRAPFNIRFGERADDFTGIMRLAQTMGLPQAEFDARIRSALDVNEALRLTALTILSGIGDTYFSATPSLPHNSRIFTPAGGGPAQFLPWDMDFIFTASASGSIFPNSSANLSKLVNHPANRRLYLWHVNDLVQTVFNPTYMAPWLAHYGSVVGQDYTSGSSYMQSRRTAALNQLPAPVPFAITSNNGAGYSVNTNFTELFGSGWLDLQSIEVNGVPYALTWSSITNWSMRVPLNSGVNPLNVQGVDRFGNRPPAFGASLSVTNSAPASRLAVVINEWMADAEGPGALADPADGLFQDWFELYNPNALPVDLGGFYLTDDLAQPTKWQIPTNTVIGARGFLLVWADENGAQNSPTNQDLHANFKLSASGESIGLFKPDGATPEHAVTFGPQYPNTSQGLFPDGAVGTNYLMTNWTPRASNRLGAPDSPQATSLSVRAGVVTFTFRASPHRTYRVEYKDDLGAPSWTALPETPRAGPEGNLQVQTGLGVAPQRFFRLRLL